MIFYSSNWLVALGHNAIPGMLNHTWSLAIEEQFYLLWPPLLYFCLSRRWSTWRLLILTVGLACSSAILRTILWNIHKGGNIYFRSDTRADGLLLGCGLATVYASAYGRDLLRRFLGLWPVGLASVTALIFFVIESNPGDPRVYNGGLFAVVICSAVIIAHVVCSERSWLTNCSHCHHWSGLERAHMACISSTSQSSRRSVRAGSVTGRVGWSFQSKSD